MKQEIKIGDPVVLHLNQGNYLTGKKVVGIVLEKILGIDSNPGRYKILAPNRGVEWWWDYDVHPL